MGDVKKIGKYMVREVMPDFLRCDYCGFTYAVSNCDTVLEAIKNKSPDLEYYKPEEGMHRLYHLDLDKVRDKFGAENVLSHLEMVDFGKSLFSTLDSLSNYDFNLSDCVVEWKQKFLKISKVFNVINIEDIKKSNVHRENEIQSTYDALVINMNSVLEFIDKESDFEIDILFAQALQKFLFSLHSFYCNYNVMLNSIDYLDEVSIFSQTVNSIIKAQDFNKQVVDTFIKNFIRFEFTRSLRLYDYANRNHPNFDDFYILLWNTPRFIKLLQGFLTDNQLNYYVNKNIANRMLAPVNIDTAPFYFGRVFVKVVLNCDFKDISYLDKLVTKMDFNLTDDSYKDNITIEEYKYAIMEWLKREVEIEKLPQIKKFD